jgi:hypothetical protein
MSDVEYKVQFNLYYAVEGGGQPPFWSPPPIGTFPPDRMASATGASA